MSDRKVTSKSGARETRFSEYQVQHGMDYREKARNHCLKRNRLVVSVLCYAAVLKGRKQGLLPGEISESPALWQDARSPRRVGQPGGSFDFTWGPRRGYGQNEAAHCLPCSLIISGKCISERFTGAGEAMVVRRPFGEVNDLPAIFNDADQLGEDHGLRNAFVLAARAVVQGQPPGAGVDFELIPRVYRETWLKEAASSYSIAKQWIGPKWEKERERRRRLDANRLSGYSKEDLTSDEDAGFYADMDEILSTYERVTRTEFPYTLKRSELEGLIDALGQAGSAAKKWPRKLELESFER